MLGVPVTEFEGDAAKDEREQHNQHGKVDSGQDDREGERKRCQKSDAAQHEPRLVAVPDRRHRVHDKVARRQIRREPIKNADPEIESVQQDIEKHAKAENDRPQGHEVEHGRGHDPALPSGCGRACTGCSGRPLSTGSGSMAGSAGPFLTILAISAMPAGNMIR